MQFDALEKCVIKIVTDRHQHTKTTEEKKVLF